MINGLIEQIKGPKKLTFDHWRYKTLHWCFGINPKTKWESKLPDAFYSHYCPLFHLTNLIVIFSPFIMFIKLILGLVRLVKYAFDQTAKVIVCVFLTRKHKPLTRKQLLEREMKNKIVFYIESGLSKEFIFSEFYSVYSEEDFSKEEFEVYYNAVVKSLEKQKLMDEIKEKEKKALKERMYFWVNFSSVFFKCGLNVFYIFAALISAYGLYKFAVLLSCYSLGYYLSLLWGFTKIFLFVGFLAVILMGLVHLFEKVKFSHRIYNIIPVNLAGKWICIFGNFIADTIESIADFFGAFYENNCPPIILEESEEEFDDTLEIQSGDESEEIDESEETSFEDEDEVNNK